MNVDLEEFQNLVGRFNKDHIVRRNVAGRCIGAGHRRFKAARKRSIESNVIKSVILAHGE